MCRALVCWVSFVAVLSLAFAGGAQAQDPNLVGWWTLSEGFGEMAFDVSGTGMHGTINNAANGLGADGSVWVDDADLGTVISFDGTASGAYVRAGDIPQMTLENNFTWAFWAKQAPGNGSNEIILGNRMDENAVDFAPRQFIKFTPTKFEWHMNGNGDDNMEYEDIPDDVWLHHVVVKTGAQLTYYRNGMAAGAGTITQALDFPQPLYFGGDNEGAEGENWAGSMSDVRIYDGALSQEQVQAIMGGPAPATLAAWEDAAKAARPGFLATNVEDGLYDIGAFGGEQTYEFVLQSNPDEEQASMCLIGRRDFGDVQAGLKYEQWNNTGTYGATLFGVADYDYGVATDPGLFTHLVFVASTEAGTTALYVNGAYAGSVDAAITLSGLVGIGYGAQDREGADPFFDDFDGAIYGVAIYDRALSLAEIRVNADTYLEKGPSDITTPGDAVLGVPNDGDWPGAETPDLAIDDDVNTKYLHFKGETEPTGFQVTPMLGSTLVTGLTLTTANDAIERDPIQFELYGSNESIDGPYELIAAGEVADFNDVDAWPRFTMNATAITFENTVAYEHYQILFPAVRDPASANSMQIAEVELIGVPVIVRPPLVLWVSFHGADDAPGADAAAYGFTEAVDKPYTDLLAGAGYDVQRYIQTGTPDLDVVNAADLVIISRSVSSGSFSGDAATIWNGVTAPMICLNGYTARSSRMGYNTGTNIPDTTGDIALSVIEPNHPIFAGIELDADGTTVNPYAGVVTYADGTVARGISIVTDPVDDEATILALVSAASADTGPVDAVVIAEIPAGATLEHDGGAGADVLAAPRLLMLTGAREASGITSQTAGMYDLYEDGAAMLLNAVAYMLQ